MIEVKFSSNLNKLRRISRSGMLNLHPNFVNMYNVDEKERNKKLILKMKSEKVKTQMAIFKNKIRR
jgi:hypothetical protein